MVQYCFRLAYPKMISSLDWYDQYEVLGDDIVLFDNKVAELYISLCSDLGVEINVKKSVISDDVPIVEFAKRTAYHGKDVSALSFKEFISNNNFFGRLNLSIRLINNR